MADQHESRPGQLSSLLKKDVSRRDFLKLGLTAGALVGAPSLLAACGSSSSSSGSSSAPASAAPSASASAVALNATTFAEAFPTGSDMGGGMTLSDGMCLAMTGQGAFFGKVMSRGAQLAANQVKGLGGVEFKISIADHQSGLVPPAVTGVRRLITENGIKTLQTSYGAPSEALVPMIAQYKILSFNGGGSSPGQLGKDFLWQNRMLFAYDPTDGALAWLAKNKPEVKKLALVGTLENGVEAIKQKAPKDWPQLVPGGTIATTEIHDVGATDFSSVIARVKSAGADAVFTVSFGNDLGYMVKQFRQANFAGPMMGIEFTAEAQKIAGALYDTYMFATDYYDPKNPNPFNVEFVKGHVAAYGVEPEYYGSNYYEQVYIIWELMRRVIKAGGDPQDTTQLQDALKAQPTFYSVYGGGADKIGTCTFNTTDHSISKPMGVFKVQNGQPVKVADIVKIDYLTQDPATALVS